MSYVLITGASSGIGTELAKKFAKKGFDLFLVARNENRLLLLKEELFKVNQVDIQILSCDLSMDDGPKKVYEFSKKNNMLVSVLVNNAGYGDFGKFIDGDLEKYKNMIDLNNKALMSLSYLYIKDMKADHYGHIINIASIAGFMPGPYMAVYYASKAFVLSFSAALREELKEDNVHVTTFCPGPVNTDFWNRAGVKMSKTKSTLFARSPKQVAKTGIKAFENNKGIVVDGFINNLAVIGAKLGPTELVAKIAKKAQKKLSTTKE